MILCLTSSTLDSGLTVFIRNGETAKAFAVSYRTGAGRMRRERRRTRLHLLKEGRQKRKIGKYVGYCKIFEPFKNDYMTYNTTNNAKESVCASSVDVCVDSHGWRVRWWAPGSCAGPEPSLFEDGPWWSTVMTKQDSYCQLLAVSLQITLKSVERFHGSRPEPLAQDSLGISQRWTERHQLAVWGQWTLLPLSPRLFYKVSGDPEIHKRPCTHVQTTFIYELCIISRICNLLWAFSDLKWFF